MNRRQAILTTAIALAAAMALAGCSGLDGQPLLHSEPAATDPPAAVPLSDAPQGVMTPTPYPTDVIATLPVAAQEYRERFYQGLDYGSSIELTLDEVRELYTQTATAFPYPLPQGWAFPADPGYYDDPSLGPNWSKALAVMRVFNFWEYANATEAIAAYKAADTEKFEHLMTVLHDGYVGVLPPNYEPQNGEWWFDTVFNGWHDGIFSNYATTFYNPFPYTAH